MKDYHESDTQRFRHHVKANLCCWDSLSDEQKAIILARPRLAASENLSARVTEIIAEVKESKDQAVRQLTQAIDGVDQSSTRVDLPSKLQVIQSFETQHSLLWKAVKVAYEQIYNFHQLQLREDVCLESAQGALKCERLVRPLQKVGFYIPGGQAPLISTVLMLAVPAQLAGVSYRVLCTPPLSDGGVPSVIRDLAVWCDIHEVHAVGGAQAIAAMAYGTETITAVDKIFGPGNLWVTEAKKQLACRDDLAVCMDMPAGPSEVMVVVGASARAEYVAADLLAQAEHGVDSQVICVYCADLTTSQDLHRQVLTACEQQWKVRSRSKVILAALQHSRFIQVSQKQQAYEVINDYAPEHLIIQMDSARDFLAGVTHAGSVFLGHHTPESFGDYASGPNHVLPTSGYARCMGGLSVESFQKTMTVQEYTPQTGITPDFMEATKTLAQYEGLDAHHHSVMVRHLETETNSSM